MKRKWNEKIVAYAHKELWSNCADNYGIDGGRSQRRRSIVLLRPGSTTWRGAGWKRESKNSDEKRLNKQLARSKLQTVHEAGERGYAGPRVRLCSRTLATLRNRTAVRLRTAEWRIKISRKTKNAQSRATFFRHSAVLSLTAVLLRNFKTSVNQRETPKNVTHPILPATVIAHRGEPSAEPSSKLDEHFAYPPKRRTV